MTQLRSQKCQLLLYSQLADFELNLGFLTNGVGRLAVILEDVLDPAFDVFCFLFFVCLETTATWLHSYKKASLVPERLWLKGHVHQKD